MYYWPVLGSATKADASCASEAPEVGAAWVRRGSTKSVFEKLGPWIFFCGHFGKWPAPKLRKPQLRHKPNQIAIFLHGGVQTTQPGQTIIIGHPKVSTCQQAGLIVSWMRSLAQVQGQAHDTILSPVHIKAGGSCKNRNLDTGPGKINIHAILGVQVGEALNLKTNVGVLR